MIHVHDQDFKGEVEQAFHEAYGPPGDGAHDRMVRILAHEYVHLLTYAAWPDHRAYRTTPWDRALWTLFFEGLGDYVSVSARWRPVDGRPSPAARKALSRLEPRMLDRLEALRVPGEHLGHDLPIARRRVSQAPGPVWAADARRAGP